MLNQSPGEIVIDPFLGGGTTLVACEQIGRTCFGLELDPAYCDVIVERWQNLTGEKRPAKMETLNELEKEQRWPIKPEYREAMVKRLVRIIADPGSSTK